MDETKCYIKAEDALTNGCPNKRARVSRSDVSPTKRPTLSLVARCNEPYRNQRCPEGSQRHLTIRFLGIYAPVKSRPVADAVPRGTTTKKC